MKERNPYFDNAKAMLIYLVVLGHLLSEFLYENDIVSSSYLFIYLFHMPAFILISGYFTKGINKPGYVAKLAKKLLIPYVIFQVFYTVYYLVVFGDEISISLFIPRWALWFLLSLFFWNVMLIVFSKIKYSLIFAVILSLAVGYDPHVDGFLSLSRTIFFFPFFLLGYYLKEDHFMRLKKKTTFIASSICMIAIFLIIYNTLPLDLRQWLMGKQPYEHIGDVLFEFAWGVRLIVYVLMGVVSLLFFMIVPRKETFFTHIGKQTLSIYLLHMALVKLLHESPLVPFINEQNQYWLLLIASFVIVFLLTRKPVLLLMRLVVK